MSKSQTHELAVKLLRQAAKLRENDERDGRVNMFLINGIGAAAKLLDVGDVVRLTERILRQAPDASFFAGMMGSSGLPTAASPRMRRLPSMEELKDRYPSWSKDFSRRAAESSAPQEAHLRSCLDGDWERAWEQAGDNDYHLSDVAASQAAFGDLAGAIQRVADPCFPKSRRRHIQIVCAIELARAGSLSESEAMIDSLDESASDLQQWDLLALSLGIAGYQPWGGYPYADY